MVKGTVPAVKVKLSERSGRGRNIGSRSWGRLLSSRQQVNRE